MFCAQCDSIGIRRVGGDAPCRRKVTRGLCQTESLGIRWGEAHGARARRLHAWFCPKCTIMITDRSDEAIINSIGCDKCETYYCLHCVGLKSDDLPDEWVGYATCSCSA